jgi:hypothetical protein
MGPCGPTSLHEIAVSMRLHWLASFTRRICPLDRSTHAWNTPFAGGAQSTWSLA